MIRRLSWLAAAAAIVLPSLASGQTFKTEQFDIKGDGEFDYLSVDPGTGHVFVSRGSHVMAVDGATGKVLGDVLNLMGTHGAQIVPKHDAGYTTNGRDSTVTVFDLKTFATTTNIQTHTGGLDGFSYDDFTDRVFTGNHSRPQGSATAIDPKNNTMIGSVTLDGTPEGAVSDGKGTMFINLEDKNAIQLFDPKTLKAGAVWPIAPCEGPTGLGIDRANNRLFIGCSKISVVVDSKTGKVVAQFPVGQGVDALGWDASQKLIYVPAGDGTVTVVHQDSPDKYTVVAAVQTMRGARTIVVDDVRHRAYVFTPEYGPAPTPAAGTPPPAPGGRGGGPRGPMLAAWLIAISH